MTKKLKDFIYHTGLLVAGSVLCATAVQGILVPHGFFGRGLTGAALLVHYCYPVLPVGALYLLLNIPVFSLGWRFVGLRFVLYSAWGMVIYSALLYLIPFRFDLGDKMLSAVIAGALSGTGIAVILRSYGSTGGAEILCVIFNKLFSLSLGTGSMAINALLLGVAALLFPIENVLYTLVYAAVSSHVTDKVFHGLAKRRAAIIISEQWREITQELTATHRLGITRISGVGGYRGTDKTLLYSVLHRKHVPSLKRAVLERDPHAFIALMTAEDVTGVEVGNQPHW